MPVGDAPLVHRLKCEFDFYGVVLPVPPDVFEGTTLLNIDQQKKVQEWLPDKSVWKLIYKGSVNGFGGADFHKNCDNKGETVSVICSTSNYLFGGYTPASWTSAGNYTNSPPSFLFTLTNPANVPAKYLNTNAAYSIHNNGTYGPTFGGGHDLYVANNCAANNSSATNFPHSYGDTTGRGNATFTGAANFQVRDIEVFIKKV